MQREQMERSVNSGEIVRYIINGVIATAIHFSVLTINIEIFHFQSAGVANFVAALFGISASFLGSRYYVYREHSGTFISHAVKFSFLYASIALLHGFILYLWTDKFGLDWRVGFVVATFVQVALSYIGNKVWVFTK